jgi:hypothetical protein
MTIRGDDPALILAPASRFSKPRQMPDGRRRCRSVAVLAKRPDWRPNHAMATEVSTMRALVWVVVSAALGALAPAHAAVKDSSPAGFTLENHDEVPVSADVAWRALVNDVDQWWPSDHTWWGDARRLSIVAKPGGCFCERNGKQQAQHLVVTLVDPGRTLRLRGGLGPLQGMGLDGTLEFRLQPGSEGGTRITLWYRVGGYTPDDLSAFAPVVDRVQAGQLRALADFLRARAAPPAEER